MLKRMWHEKKGGGGVLYHLTLDIEYTDIHVFRFQQ